MSQDIDQTAVRGGDGADHALPPVAPFTWQDFDGAGVQIDLSFEFTFGENLHSSVVLTQNGLTLGSDSILSSSTLTIADPLVGFYYSLKQGGTVTNLLFNADSDRNKLGGRDAITFDLTKPEDAGFYQPLVTPTEYGD